MIEDKDYIMRLTHEVVRTLIRLLFQKDIDKDEEAGVSAEMAVRYRELLAMIKDGQVNEAENLLLDEMDPDNPAYFELGLLFYEKLGAQTEEFLESHERSRLRMYLSQDRHSMPDVTVWLAERSRLLYRKSWESRL